MAAELYRLDVLCTWTLWTPAFCEGDFLTFVQIFKADTLDARGVEKEVFFAARIDEPETLVRQFFNAAFGHLRVPLS